MTGIERIPAAAVAALLLLGIAGCERGGARNDVAPAAPAAPASPQRSVVADLMTITTHKDCIEPLKALTAPRKELSHCTIQQITSAAIPASAFVAQPASVGSKKCDASTKTCVEAVVVVTPTPNGGCTAGLMYDVMTVHKSASRRTVTWTINAPAGSSYEFAAASADSDGYGGIAMLVPSSDAPYPDPKKWWAADAGSKADAAVMQILQDPPTTLPRFCHYPRVQQRGSKTLCCPIDPIIINDPD